MIHRKGLTEKRRSVGEEGLTKKEGPSEKVRRRGEGLMEKENLMEKEGYRKEGYGKNLTHGFDTM